MKKTLLCFAILLVLAVALAPGVLAADAEIPELALPQLETYYIAFSGQVTEINPFYQQDGSESGKLFVLTEGPEGHLMNFVVDEATVMLTKSELKVGSAITGYYLSNRPAILIYPPQMHADLLAVELPAEQTIKVALFDENLISADNELKLNIGPDTVIELQDGSKAPADAVLGGNFLAVFYTVSTRSIPAQTTPQRIVVLEQEEEEISPPATDDFAVDGMPLVVAGEPLEAPPIYVHDSGAVMIPLRAVAEALGYEVGWENGVVTLNGQAMLVIGQDTYTFNEDAPLQLTAAAELHNGSTYVPLNFFREVLKLNNAYVLEQHVFIDNGEKME